MYGQRQNTSRNGLLETGGFPILAQQIQGYKSQSKQITLIPLYVTGERGELTELNRQNENHRFELSAGNTFVYEVIFN